MQAQKKGSISKRTVVRSSKSVQVQKKCNEVQKKCFPSRDEIELVEAMTTACAICNNSSVDCYWTAMVARLQYVHTSSTAKGGGGSFKNRKPIGEVGCCESRMTERSH